MSYDVKITRHGPHTLFDLKGRPAAIRDWARDGIPAFPEHPNTRASRDGADLCHIGRNHWILRAAFAREAGLEEVLQPTACPGDISIVRVSDTLAFFTITGSDAADIMSIACPLDLHPGVFGPDAVTYSELFGLKALVQRCEGGFEVAVEQSFGDMVEDYLTRTNQ